MAKNASKDPATKGSSLNKAAWIRALPAEMSAADVVKRAKDEGIKLTLAQVYVTRSLAKKRERKASGAVSPAGGKRGSKAKVSSLATPPRGEGAGSKDLRTEFVRLVMKIGTDEARRLLERVEDVQMGTLGR